MFAIMQRLDLMRRNLYMQLLLQKPVITARLDSTYTLIPMHNHPDYYNWLCMNTVLLKVNSTNFDDYDFNFLHPVFRSTTLIQDVMSFGNIKYSENLIEANLIKMIKERLDDGYYACCHLDDFYIPNKNFFKKTHFTHINFIYGYDDDKGTLLTYGYNDHGVCVEAEVPYICIVNGYKKSLDKYLNFLKPNLENKVNMDLEFLAKYIECYLNPSISTKDALQPIINEPRTIGTLYTQGLLFGVEAQQYLVDRIKLNKDDDSALKDVRTFQILIEHKKCMLWRLNYINQFTRIPKHLIERYEKNVQLPCEILKNLVLKLRIKEDASLHLLISKILQDVLNDETEILTEFLRIIKQY